MGEPTSNATDGAMALEREVMALQRASFLLRMREIQRSKFDAQEDCARIESLAIAPSGPLQQVYVAAPVQSSVYAQIQREAAAISELQRISNLLRTDAERNTALVPPIAESKPATNQSIEELLANIQSKVDKTTIFTRPQSIPFHDLAEKAERDLDVLQKKASAEEASQRSRLGRCVALRTALGRELAAADRLLAHVQRTVRERGLSSRTTRVLEYEPKGSTAEEYPIEKYCGPPIPSTSSQSETPSIIGGIRVCSQEEPLMIPPVAREKRDQRPAAAKPVRAGHDDRAFITPNRREPTADIFRSAHSSEVPLETSAVPVSQPMPNSEPPARESSASSIVSFVSSASSDANPSASDNASNANSGLQSAMDEAPNQLEPAKARSTINQPPADAPRSSTDFLNDALGTQEPVQVAARKPLGRTPLSRSLWDEDRARQLFLQQLLSCPAVTDPANDNGAAFGLESTQFVTVLRALIAHREALSRLEAGRPAAASGATPLTFLETAFDPKCTVKRRAEIFKGILAGRGLVGVQTGEAGTLTLALVSHYPGGLVPGTYYQHVIQVQPAVEPGEAPWTTVEDREPDLKSHMDDSRARFWTYLLQHYGKMLGHSWMQQQRSTTGGAMANPAARAQQGRYVNSQDLAFLLSDIALPQSLRLDYVAREARLLLESMRQVRQQSLSNSELERLLVAPDGLLLQTMLRLQVAPSEATVMPSLAQIIVQHPGLAERAFQQMVVGQVLRHETVPLASEWFAPGEAQTLLVRELLQVAGQAYLAAFAQGLVAHIASVFRNVGHFDLQRGGMFQATDPELQPSVTKFAAVLEWVSENALGPALSARLPDQLLRWSAFARRECQLRFSGAESDLSWVLWLTHTVAYGLQKLALEDLLQVMSSDAAAVALKVVRAVASALEMLAARSSSSVSREERESVGLTHVTAHAPAFARLQRQWEQLVASYSSSHEDQDDLANLETCEQQRGHEYQLSFLPVQSFLLRKEPAISAQVVAIAQAAQRHLYSAAAGKSGSSGASATALSALGRSGGSSTFRLFEGILLRRATQARSSQSLLSLNV